MTIREKIIEIMTYIVVPSAFLVLSPALGKFLDSLILKNNHLFASYPIILITGIFISLIGVSLSLWSIFLFKKYGKGTPNPTIPPKEFVIRGPYKIVRNPMALGGAILLFGEVLIYYSTFLLVISVIYVVTIYLNAMFIEEPELKKRFGQPYEQYLKEVPRFLPNIFQK